MRRGGTISQAWLVLALAVCFGAALAEVDVALKDRIEANRKAETFSKVPDLVPGAAVDKTTKVKGGIEIDRDGRKVRYDVYRAADTDGKHVGWVVRHSGSGFVDKITVLIGLDRTADRITGMRVLEQKETPGLGNRIENDGYFGQFAGKDAAKPLVVVKTGATWPNHIEAVSGATKSSRYVADIVNEAVADLRPVLEKRALEGAGNDGE
jgi:electron transport complex protein RnfG